MFDNQISTILGPDSRRLRKQDSVNIKEQLNILESQYLILAQKVKQLESFSQASAMCSGKCHNASPVTTTRKRYSEALSGTQAKPNIDPLCTLRVYPKSAPGASESSLKSPEATKQLLQRLDLKGKKIGIKHIKSIGGNGVSVLCRDQSDVQILSEAIKANQDENLEVKLQTKRNPTMTMLLKGKDHDMVDIKEDIISKNEFIGDADVFQIKHNYSTKNGNTIVVIEVTPKTYQAIARNESKLYVGWTRVSLREQDPVTQCFKCHRYGHKSRNCRYMVDGTPATRCCKCAGHHTQETPCTELCCSNCHDFNTIAAKRKWSLHDTKHSATDENCPIRIQAIARARALINYV